MDKIRFDQFIKLNRGFDLPDASIKEGPYPVVASTSVKAYHAEYKINGPAVVTGRSGSLGKVQYIPGKCWPLNTSLYVRDFKGNDPKYVYYFLQTMHLERFNAGAGVPTLNQNHLHSMKLMVHSKKEQKIIASTLSQFDDLIENNKTRIEILEQSAANLYKEWFVRLRFPGHEIAEFENGLPKGWVKARLGDICPFVRGKNITADEMIPGAFPVISAGITPSGAHNKSNVHGVSITISSSGANAGYVSLHYSDIWAADCSYVSEKETPYIYYAYELLNNLRTVIYSLQRGAAQPHVYPKDTNRVLIILPDEQLRSLANEKLRELHSMVFTLKQQNEILEKQRDLLLPRLMSGKLEVK